MNYKFKGGFMVKGKDVWVIIILECISCVWNDIKKEFVWIFRYII